MIIKRMAAAVRALDLVTGQVIDDGSVRIYMEDGAAGIKKKDGYIIFWDNDMPRRKLILESPFYEREEIVLDMEVFRQKRMPRLLVWLKPGRQYPYPSSVRLETRYGTPLSTQRVYLESSVGLIRLRAAYPADRLEPCLIELKIPPGLPVEGRPLRIKRISDGYREDFCIWQARNESAGLYELVKPLEEVYSVYDEEIGFVLEMKVGKDGSYQVPFVEE